MERPDFTRHMARLAAAFDKDLDGAVVAVYWDDLGALDEATFAEACRRARTEGTYFPRIAELLRYAREAAVRDGRAFDGETAWAALEARVLRRYSPGVTREFDWPDETTADIVRRELGGVHFLAHVESDYVRNDLRKQFVALYERRRAATTGALPAPRLRALTEEAG